MNIATKIRYGLARMLVKGAAFGIVPTWIRATFMMPTFQALTDEGYRKNAVVFSCISALAFAFPEPPLLVWDDDSDAAQPLPKHPLRVLLRRPNARMSERDMAIFIMTYMAIGGNCYLHKVRNKRGDVIELWPYHIGHVKPLPGGDTWLLGYEFSNNGGDPTFIPTEDIVHLKWPSIDLRQPWIAQAPLLAASREVDSDNEATRYMKALLDNDAVPPGILTLPPDDMSTDDDVRRMKALWKDQYGGGNRGNIAVLRGGATFQQTSMNMEQLAFDALHRIPEQRITAVLRTPAVVAGFGDDPTYANSGNAYERWTRSTLIPLWDIVGDQMQSGLAADFGNDVVVGYDTSQVHILQEDEDGRYKRVLDAYSAGIIPDVDEARGLLNLPKLTPAQMQQVISVAKPTPPALSPPVPEPPIEGEIVKQRKALELKASAQRTARALQRIRAGIVKDMTTAIEGYFSDLAAAIVTRAQGKKADDLPTIEQLLLGTDEKALRDMVTRYYTEVMAASWETWNISLGVEVAFDLADPVVAATLKTAGAQVKLISDTTRSAVQDLLSYGAEQGWSIGQFIRGDDTRPGLRDLVEQTYKGRAETISRTELANAQAFAAAARYEQAGVTRVLILDGGGDDSDDICNQLNNTTQTLAWYKDNPIQHPRCTRAAAPIVGD